MEIIFCLTQEWILSKRWNRAKNLQILQFAQGKLALIHGKWWCKLRVFKGGFRFVHLYHHSFAHDNRGQQFASCNFSRRSTIFRNPTSCFLVGLAIVDLLTALIQEPIYATCFMLMYFQHPWWTKCVPWMKFAAYFSAFPISISAFIVLLLHWRSISW